jgi:hypothetical protein
MDRFLKMFSKKNKNAEQQTKPTEQASIIILGSSVGDDSIPMANISESVQNVETEQPKFNEIVMLNTDVSVDAKKNEGFYFKKYISAVESLKIVRKFNS